LNRALILAVHRGVDVRVLVPLHSNHRLADMAGRSYLRELQQEGARVLYYEAGMVHAKVVLMDDDIAMLGSANIDMRSLLLNYETAIFVYSIAEIQATVIWMTALMEEAHGRPGHAWCHDDVAGELGSPAGTAAIEDQAIVVTQVAEGDDSQV